MGKPRHEIPARLQLRIITIAENEQYLPQATAELRALAIQYKLPFTVLFNALLRCRPITLLKVWCASCHDFVTIDNFARTKCLDCVARDYDRVMEAAQLEAQP